MYKDGKKKILFTATVWGFFNFLRHDIRMLSENGWEVHVATNFNLYSEPIEPDDIVIKHQIDFSRLPLKKENMKAYRQLSGILKQERFDIIHCHTVIASVITRLAAAKYRRQGTKIFYTAHGFNFYKGAPKKNWLLYFPVEWLLSWKTDLQLTINREDYELARRHLHAKETEYVPGVGVDLKKFHHGESNAETKRKELGIKEEEIMLLSVGEYSERKNHAVIIRALARLGRKDIKLVIAGNGKLETALKTLGEELSVAGQLALLGYRRDVAELCQAADMFVLSSHYEGLSVALMEAIACETPVICSHIRGNEDLIRDEDWMFDQRDIESVLACMQRIIGSRTREELRDFARDTVCKNRENLNGFDLSSVAERMKEIYSIDG